MSTSSTIKITTLLLLKVALTMRNKSHAPPPVEVRVGSAVWGLMNSPTQKARRTVVRDRKRLLQLHLRQSPRSVERHATFLSHTMVSPTTSALQLMTTLHGVLLDLSMMAQTMAIASVGPLQMLLSE